MKTTNQYFIIQFDYYVCKYIHVFKISAQNLMRLVLFLKKIIKATLISIRMYIKLVKKNTHIYLNHLTLR